MSRPASLLDTAARSDIQGLLASGYGHLPLAEYLFVRIVDPAAGRRWIDDLIGGLATAAPWPRDDTGETVKPPTAVNVAFTADGLTACAVPASVLCTFPVEFVEGIASARRSRILGDTAESAPEKWELGGPATEPLHAVVIVHALDERRREAAVALERARLERTGGGVVLHGGPAQRGYRPDTQTEPFGFRDGIAQPDVVGLDGRGVPTGEFILGYPNHYDVMPPTPAVPGALDLQRILPALANPYHDASLRDLGRHGSFVVYRKLQQHVAAFWRALREESVRLRGTADAAFMIRLASKMVGRWPSGAPLVQAPHADDPRLANEDRFEYGADPEGLACPIGSHVRRSNPRDDLKPYPADQSRHMAEAHRILRRARVFGPPAFDPALLRADASPAARDRLVSLEDDGEARGIHFFCVNASIRSQFEFVQQTWCNNASFGGLSANKDPLVGDHARDGDPPTRMVIPEAHAPIRTAPLPRVVTVLGGAYLFMPSLTALRYLAAGTYVSH